MLLMGPAALRRWRREQRQEEALRAADDDDNGDSAEAAEPGTAAVAAWARGSARLGARGVAAGGIETNQFRWVTMLLGDVRAAEAVASLCRVAVATDDEIAALEARWWAAASTPAESPRRPASRSSRGTVDQPAPEDLARAPLSAANEARATAHMLDATRAALHNYPTTAAEDRALLSPRNKPTSRVAEEAAGTAAGGAAAEHDGGGRAEAAAAPPPPNAPAGSRRRNAILARLGEKAVLEVCVLSRDAARTQL